MQNVFPQKSQHDAIQYWQYHSIKIIQMTGRYAQLAVNWFWEWTGNQYHSGILPIKPNLVCNSVCTATETLSNVSEESDLPTKKHMWWKSGGRDLHIQNFRPEIASVVILSHHRLDLHELHCVSLGRFALWNGSPKSQIELPWPGSGGVGS